MTYIMEAACLSNVGAVRKQNEDNFMFNGAVLDPKSTGISRPLEMKRTINANQFVALFDGMGGENYGHYAALVAAERMRSEVQKYRFRLCATNSMMSHLCAELNQAVLEKQQLLHTNHMGTTFAACCFSRGYARLINIGDSRIYLLSSDSFSQLSIDHNEKKIENKKKASLVQYLGIDPEVFQIEPAIYKKRLFAGEQYLLCTDGISDVLSDSEIKKIMISADTPTDCVSELINTSLIKNGRDNMTAIVCKIYCA